MLDVFFLKKKLVTAFRIHKLCDILDRGGREAGGGEYSSLVVYRTRSRDPEEVCLYVCMYIYFIIQTFIALHLFTYNSVG